MHLITLQLTGPTDAQLDPASLVELIEWHSEAVDRVEHQRIHSGPGRVDLALFLLADDAAAAELTARALCRRAVERTPWLAEWQLAGVPCDP